jgi:hypothetical protein
MTDFDGMRDVGEYNFEFAVTSYMGDFSENTIVKDGMVFNREFITTDGVLTLKKYHVIKIEML